MESYYVALGFYKNQRRYLSLDAFGRIVVTEDFSKALQMERTTAALAALAASNRFNLTHCRAISVDEAQNAEPI